MNFKEFQWISTEFIHSLFLAAMPSRPGEVNSLVLFEGAASL